jgi:hypothetical protein
MKRRTALQIIALGALAPKLDELASAVGYPPERTAWIAADYKPRFFTAEENQLLDRLMEMIIPADAHSPGAHAAQVSLFADLMVATSRENVQKQWREGLRQMREEAAGSSLSDALAKSAVHEGRPTSDFERFFQALKQMTVNGYYTSAIGIHEDLQYQGNTYLSAYPGCRIKNIAAIDD